MSSDLSSDSEQRSSGSSSGSDDDFVAEFRDQSEEFTILPYQFEPQRELSSPTPASPGSSASGNEIEGSRGRTGRFKSTCQFRLVCINYKSRFRMFMKNVQCSKNLHM